MTNHIDFTISHYKDILLQAKGKYDFRFFEDVSPETLSNTDLILRHDIDLSLDAAVRSAKVEESIGVKGTYFIRLNATYYNPFSSVGHPLVKEILKSGHAIGLHFDPSFYSNLSMSVTDAIEMEISALEKHFDTEVRAISQHRPFSLGEPLTSDIPHLWEKYTYNEFFQDSFKYISDSGQNWREGDLRNHVNCGRPLHVLTHPVWWTETGKGLSACLRDASEEASIRISNKTDTLVDRYQKYLKDRA